MLDRAMAFFQFLSWYYEAVFVIELITGCYETHCRPLD